MQPFFVPILPPPVRIRPRTALVASADRSFRQRLSEILTGLRWQVRESEGGAQAWGEAESAQPEAFIVDSWLPDLDLNEFLTDFRRRFPEVDLVTAGGAAASESPRGPYRQELLYALRRSQDSDSAAWNAVPVPTKDFSSVRAPSVLLPISSASAPASTPRPQDEFPVPSAAAIVSAREAASSDRLPELVGNAPCMFEIGRRIRLVAPRATPVLIQGPTGSGKEIVAEALHRLSARSRKRFVAINCAAIPEPLLEAELFGHTREWPRN